MFNMLIVSGPRPKRAWRRGLGGPTLSLAAHCMIVYAAVTATATSGAGDPAPVRDTIVRYLRLGSQRTPEPRVPIGPKVFRTLVAPVTVPNGIPPIDLTEVWDPRRYTGVGIELGPDTAEDSPTDVTRVFVAELVDEPPQRIAFPPPDYPRRLLEARIEGSVVLEAVIDTLGNPEPSTIRVVSSTNAGFNAAAQAAFRRALFRPGRVQGQRVRVLVRQPLTFALPR